MAFNSNTYHANKSAKSAYAHIRHAKDIKRRAAIGEAYAWEVERIPTIVKYARWDMRRSIFFRSL
jgi:hypothetical protein